MQEMFVKNCVVFFRRANLSLVKNVSRKFSSQPFQQTRGFEEIRIPVPWGQIAAKWWGPHDKIPILACHGWQDNSGSFDRLIPYLPSNIGVLAIDFPGHGLSSRMPPGMYYHGLDFPLFLVRIVDYFKWPKVSFLAHSLGAMESYHFATMFPDRTEFLICLDTLPTYSADDQTPEDFRKDLLRYLKYDHFCTHPTEPPSHPYEELADIWHKGSFKSVEKDNCKYILERTIAPSKSNPNLFYFTRDPRIKAGIKDNLSRNQILEEAKRVTFPICVFKADDSVFYSRTPLFYEVLDIIRKTSKDCRIIEVEGTHHVHLNNPERVGGHITEFIETHYTERMIDEKTRREIKSC